MPISQEEKKKKTLEYNTSVNKSRTAVMSDDFINAHILFPSSFQDVMTASQDGPPAFTSVLENKQRLNFTHQTTRDLMCVI